MKHKTLKQLSFSKKYNKAGRNSAGCITMFHRGGGSMRLLRRIDWKRNIMSTGIVHNLEYDPNRSANIALVKWSSFLTAHSQNSTQTRLLNVSTKTPLAPRPFSYILAPDQLKIGDKVVNLQKSSIVMYDKINEQIGTCIPLCNIPIGCYIHNIEMRPGQGGKLVRSAGTFAQLVKKLDNIQQCVVRLPSGIFQQINSECRATVGCVSNLSHNTQQLTKAGQRRWLGKRPVVRGVAMNPIDHPHGGGEGRTKGGRPSVSPWGKPTKGGFKTVFRKRKK